MKQLFSNLISRGNIMSLKQILCFFGGYVYMPDEALHINGKKLLHISDTPVTFFNELDRVIKKIKPDYIVHTGDLVDNIKLQMYPLSIYRYENYIKSLLRIMENSQAEAIYLALGNHDSKEMIQKHNGRCRVIDLCEDIFVEGVKFRISHYAREILKEPKDFNLFGHDLSLKSSHEDGKQFFNGITSINIIELDSLKHHLLYYPYGTDDARLGKIKIGL